MSPLVETLALEKTESRNNQRCGCDRAILFKRNDLRKVNFLAHGSTSLRKIVRRGSEQRMCQAKMSKKQMFSFCGNVLCRRDALSSSEDVPLYTDTSDGQFLESTLGRRITVDRTNIVEEVRSPIQSLPVIARGVWKRRSPEPLQELKKMRATWAPLLTKGTHSIPTRFSII